MAKNKVKQKYGIIFLIIGLIIMVLIRQQSTTMIIEEPILNIKQITIPNIIPPDKVTEFVVNFDIINTQGENLKMECGLYTFEELNNMGYKYLSPGGLPFGISGIEINPTNNCFDETYVSTVEIKTFEIGLGGEDILDNNADFSINTINRPEGEYALLCSAFENCWGEGDINQHDYLIKQPITVKTPDIKGEPICCKQDNLFKDDYKWSGIGYCPEGWKSTFLVDCKEVDPSEIVTEEGDTSIAIPTKEPLTRDELKTYILPVITTKSSSKFVEDALHHKDYPVCTSSSQCSSGTCILGSASDSASEDRLRVADAIWSESFGKLGFVDKAVLPISTYGLCVEEQPKFLDQVKDFFGVEDDTTAIIILVVGGIFAIILLNIIMKMSAPPRRY